MIRKTGRLLYKIFYKKFALGTVPLEEIFYNLKYKNPPSAFKLIKIDPKEVEYLTIPRFDYIHYENYTHILGGDWDRRILDKEIGFLYDSQGKEYYCPRTERRSIKSHLLPFEKYTYYKSSKKHFQEEVPWEETEIYEFFLKKIEKGVKITRFETKKEVDEQLSYFDSLYRNIKEKGYKTQKELIENKRLYLKWLTTHPSNHEVLVNIGRDGEIFFEDGRHRFIIAKILGLDEIPVRVFVRHEKWQEIRDTTHEEDMVMDHPDLI